MATIDNLKEAFAGESRANRKYLAFAKRAEQDGYPQVARLFRAAAAAETVHAHAHLRAMDGVRGTIENLQDAVEGEGLEYTEMYPRFVAEAEAEGERQALKAFQAALAVEEIHHGLYTDALASVGSGQDLAARAILICEICGNTVYDKAPAVCPICGAKKERFTEVP